MINNEAYDAKIFQPAHMVQAVLGSIPGLNSDSKQNYRHQRIQPSNSSRADDALSNDNSKLGSHGPQRPHIEQAVGYNTIIMSIWLCWIVGMGIGGAKA